MTESLQINEPRVVRLQFSEPQLDLINSTAQLNLAHCGKGFGKTHVIGVKTAMYAVKYPHVRGFIGANTYNQLSKSTLVGVFKFWEEKLGFVRDRDFVVNVQPPDHFKIIGPKLERYNHTISFANGKLFFLASLDNYEMIEGMEFAHADLDETKNTKELAVSEVIISRLRQLGLYINKRGEIVTEHEEGCEGFTPLNIYTSPAKVPWISEMFNLQDYSKEIQDNIFETGNYFRKRVGNKLVVIASTYFNEHNLSPGFIDRLIDMNSHSEDAVKMAIYGSPFGKQGDEYYNRYDRFKHVKEVVCPDNCAVTTSFDFNRKPYITCGLYKTWYKEDVQRWHVHRFDEVCLPPPLNTTEHLCDELKKLYSHEFEKGLYVTGDYSGINRKTNSIETDYDVIWRVLKNYLGNTSDRVIVNEPVVNRKEFLNKVFFGSVPIDFTISPRCKNLIKDCEFLMEGPDGGKVKEKDKNGDEKYGHCSDELEYYFTSTFKMYYKPKK